MVGLKLRTSVSMITFVCFLALVLPFCVPSSVRSFVALPGGSDGCGPPGSDGGDPDDIAVNSSKDGVGVGDKGEFDVGDGHCIIENEAYTCSKEASAASLRGDSAHWLWFAWNWARQLVFNF